ncbi:MAG: hypothetical protein J6K00_07230 [Oscillospiraceae bacterium]|nr:hypothetical protein [Oscillospiraceae bacterium]
MTVLVIIFLLLALIMLIPLGVYASYDSGGLMLKLRVSAYKKQIFPRENKPEPEPEPESTEDNGKVAEKVKIRLPFSIDEWRSLLKIVFKALRRFKNSLTFDKIFLRFIAASPDPFDTVRIFNTVNSVVGAAAPFFEGEFKVRQRDIFIDTDMTSEKCSYSIELALSVRVGQLLVIALAAGFAFLKLLATRKLKQLRERKAHDGKQQTQRNDAVNNEQYQEPC